MGHWTLASDQFQQVAEGFAYLLSNTFLSIKFTKQTNKNGMGAFLSLEGIYFPSPLRNPICFFAGSIWDYFRAD